MEGAGGIGGLLGMKDGTNTAYYFADGNGNIAALYGEQGESRAVYQYDGFGNKVASSGSMSESNPFQWSSKYFHQPSGLVAYEFRFYSSTLGRWINRDPIEEAGGINLYGFVGNDAVDKFDPLGLASFSQNKDATWNVTVDKCEIVILYGHGGKKPHNFKFEDTNCSGGGFSGCHSHYTNSDIPDTNIIPYAPDIEGKSDQRANWVHVNQMVAEAKIMAQGFKCCDKVRIIVFYAPSDTWYWRLLDSLQSNDNWNKIFDQTASGGKQ
jgi:RHS repeat-associated protein